MLAPPWRVYAQKRYIIMSEYDRQNRCAFSFRQNTVNDEADCNVIWTGRLFRSFGSAEAYDRSSTVKQDSRASFTYSTDVGQIYDLIPISN